MIKTYLIPILRLLFLQNKQSLIRLRYDVGRELVVLLSGTVLLGLFYYMFHDFLHEKLSGVSPAFRASLGHQLIIILLLLLGPLAAGGVRGLWQKGPGWIAFGSRSGERQSVIQSFRWIQSVLTFLVAYGLFFAIVIPGFGFDGQSQSRLWPWVLLSLGLAAARLLLLQPYDPGEGKGSELRPMLSDNQQSRKATLLLWRWHQVLRRNRMARLCLGLTSLLSFIVALMLLSSWPFFLAILITMVASLALACAVAFQLEEDMRSVWFERQIGCSHEEFVAVYQSLCYGIGAAFGVAMFAIAFLLHPTLGTDGWKIMPIAALFPSLLPAVMFQLAPDRPLLQILVTALIGLFLATAIFAHGAALALVPLVIYYAKHYQKDNFYRT